MSIIRVTVTIFILLLFNSCTFREMGENIEDMYTDTQVIKPHQDNYQIVRPNKYKPVLYERGEKDKLKKKKRVKESNNKFTGYITQKSYDTDVDLYVYTFIENITSNYHVFYYDKKLPYRKNDLVEIQISDNFLKNIRKYHVSDSKIEDLSETKYDKFRRIRKMQENRAAHEETIIIK